MLSFPTHFLLRKRLVGFVEVTVKVTVEVTVKVAVEVASYKS
jgi:ribosomal protein L9